jgi:hypothetical protein
LDEFLLAEADPPLLHTNFTKLMRVRADVVEPKYVFYYWTLLYDLGRTARYEKQPTNIKNFKLNDFLKHEVIHFPREREIQQSIVAALDAVHSEIAACESLQVGLSSLRLAGLKELLGLAGQDV